MTQHRDIPFRDHEAAYTGAPGAPQWTADRTAFRVDATCPECHGRTSKTVRRGLPTGNKGIFRQDRPADPAVPERVTMICGCGYPHANRPPELPETGCGTAWKVPLT